MQRKDFIQQVLALTGLATLANACGTASPRSIPGRITGASATVGHWLRDGKQPGTPSTTTTTNVAIIGAGISGLSAARWLHQQGQSNFLLLDLEAQTGGNAVSGQNNTSAYPLGAHYIPLPNNDLPEYLDFLRQCAVITGADEKGQPLYNEYYLCFEPEERLYINGTWQKGLVPHHGLPPADLQQIDRFMAAMRAMREAKGSDGFFAFSIPVNRSSTDTLYTQLDQLTFKDWLQQNGYTSPYLHWYANYCTRDDFGTDYSRVSAWAGIHYFAARRGTAANAESQDVLTWPAGNGWLVAQLQKESEQQLRLNSMVLSVKQVGQGVEVLYMDVLTQQTHAILAKQCIMAVPQMVAARLLNDAERKQTVHHHFAYAPWMVANLTVGKLQERRGVDMCWDNVVYGSTALGYVDATHQNIAQQQNKKVLSYYWPLSGPDPVAERRAAQQKAHADWTALVLNDLEKLHENIRDVTENIDITLWGHGMIQPLPGFVQGTARRQMAQPINDRIFFAHTDIAGISIFEEAFYQGIAAAQAVLKQNNA